MQTLPDDQAPNSPHWLSQFCCCQASRADQTNRIFFFEKITEPEFTLWGNQSIHVLLKNCNIDAHFYDVNLYGVMLQMKGQCLNEITEQMVGKNSNNVFLIP